MRLSFDMNMYELMSAHCVMVNNGSGVLVSALSNKYSYVLTARHVLCEANKLVNHVGEEIKVIDVYSHSNSAYDCAVIKVEYVPDIQQVAWSADTLNHHAPLIVAGFPALRRSLPEKIKHQDGKMSSIVEEKFIFTAEGTPPKDLINGMSGSGVYYLRNGEAYLIGVEHSMDGSKDIEMFGRLQCQSLRRFEEIISTCNLAPMVPCFLECFSRLKDQIFGFNVIDPSNVKKLKEKLDSVADLLVANGLPAPHKLMMQYSKSLLLSDEHESVIFDKELWVAYFEFVIICAILDNVDTVDEEYLLDLERKRRIVHSSSKKNWVRHLAEILRAAKKMLDKEGVIVVSSPQEDAPLSPPKSYLAGVIDDISSIPAEGNLLQIDNVSDDIYTTYVITHLKGLRNHCVIGHEWEYGDAKASSQLLLFREKYNEFIK